MNLYGKMASGIVLLPKIRMKNIYYEIAEALQYKFPHTYYVLHDIGPGTLGNMHYATRSERIWIENERGIAYAKNRDSGIEAVVDLEEFMWVKLKSSTIL
jgi:hypothetical protein